MWKPVQIPGCVFLKIWDVDSRGVQECHDHMETPWLTQWEHDFPLNLLVAKKKASGGCSCYSYLFVIC